MSKRSNQDHFSPILLLESTLIAESAWPGIFSALSPSHLHRHHLIQACPLHLHPQCQVSTAPCKVFIFPDQTPPHVMNPLTQPRWATELTGSWNYLEEQDRLLKFSKEEGEVLQPLTVEPQYQEMSSWLRLLSRPLMCEEFSELVEELLARVRVARDSQLLLEGGNQSSQDRMT